MGPVLTGMALAALLWVGIDVASRVDGCLSSFLKLLLGYYSIFTAGVELPWRCSSDLQQKNLCSCTVQLWYFYLPTWGLSMFMFIFLYSRESVPFGCHSRESVPLLTFCTASLSCFGLLKGICSFCLDIYPFLLLVSSLYRKLVLQTFFIYIFLTFDQKKKDWWTWRVANGLFSRRSKGM